MVVAFRIDAQRNPDVRTRIAVEIELRCQNSDHHVRRSVERNGFSEQAGVGAEIPVPQLVRDHGNAAAVRAVFPFGEAATSLDGSAEQAQRGRSGFDGRDLIRIGAPGQRDRAVAVSGYVPKGVILAPPDVELGSRASRRGPRRGGQHELNDPVRVGIGKGLQQNGVDHGKNAGGGADAERQRGHRREREDGTLAKRSPGEFQVLQKLDHPSILYVSSASSRSALAPRPSRRILATGRSKIFRAIMGQVIAKESGPSLPDLPTVIAIALVVYTASNVLHEAVGHGGACLAFGGKPLVLSSVHFECGEQAISALAVRGVAAAGTIVNFITGGLALVVLKTANPLHKPHAAYSLWLLATLNLLSGAGYFLFSGIGGIGDWADVARGTMPPFVWRPAMSVFGGALYFLLARQSAQWLRALVGGGEFSMRRSRRLTVPAYIAGGLLYCLSGWFNPVGPVLIAISAGASSFGGASGLLWLTMFLRRREHSAAPGAALDRSYVWIAAGCVVSLIFVAILGPSIRF